MTNFAKQVAMIMCGKHTHFLNKIRKITHLKLVYGGKALISKRLHGALHPA